MKIIIYVLIICFCLACNSNSINQEKSANKQYFIFDSSLYEDKFKFHNLKSFEIEKTTWGDRNSELNYLNEIDYVNIYQHKQDSTRFSFHKKSYDFLAYYSIQPSKHQLHSITVLWQTEQGYCNGIDYLIYNKKGQLIDTFTLAQSCGDAGYYEYSYGEFTNDSTYHKIYKNNYELEEFESDKLSVTENQYTITRSGKIKEIKLKSYIEKI